MAGKKEKEPMTYLEIAGSLAEEIEYGVYTPGGRLPPIRIMAAKKKVSYAAMYRAYQYLEWQEIICHYNGWGYYVKKRDGGWSA
ncbi:MAG: GntR family transcriptional regulator [Oscillospiraceae bacterium]